MVGFYVDIPSKALRFGDVVRGFTAATPTIDKPSVSVIQDYSLKIINPSYLAILSPCCSISDKMISLAPLVLIPGKLFRNPYFSEDLTNINREMQPQ